MSIIIDLCQHHNCLKCSNLRLPQIRLSYIHRCEWEIHKHICQGFYKIGCHRAFGKFGKFSYRPEIVSCNNQPDLDAVCVTAPNHFSLMLHDVITCNDVTSTTCSHKYAKKVHFTDIYAIKSFSLIYWGSKLFDYPLYLHEVIIDSNAFICG